MDEWPDRGVNKRWEYRVYGCITTRMIQDWEGKSTKIMLGEGERGGTIELGYENAMGRGGIHV